MFAISRHIGNGYVALNVLPGWLAFNTFWEAVASGYAVEVIDVNNDFHRVSWHPKTGYRLGY